MVRRLSPRLPSRIPQPLRQFQSRILQRDCRHAELSPGSPTRPPFACNLYSEKRGPQMGESSKGATARKCEPHLRTTPNQARRQSDPWVDHCAASVLLSESVVTQQAGTTRLTVRRTGPSGPESLPAHAPARSSILPVLFEPS